MHFIATKMLTWLQKASSFGEEFMFVLSFIRSTCVVHYNSLSLGLGSQPELCLGHGLAAQHVDGALDTHSLLPAASLQASL